MPFEKIFDSRYLNQTYKLATAQKEIVDKIDTVKTDWRLSTAWIVSIS
mgnify:CR=1 FL=1